MALFNNIWSGLKLGYQKGYIKLGNEAMPFIDLRYRKAHDGTLVYKSHAAYKSVFEFLVRQTALQLAERTLNGLWPRFKANLEREQREYVLTQQNANRVTLIQMGQALDANLGEVRTTEGNFTYIAKDKYGTKIPDALMLYYDAENMVTVTDKVKTASANAMWDAYTAGDDNTVTAQTKTVCFIDLAPEVSCSSSKNLVLSNVQGRDYSRKELVSGGDLKFSVSGNIVYDEPDIAPDNDVKKFIQMMEYGGILHVNHRMFRQFGVTSVIVQDFSLGKPDMKNMQPYSFSCVAVEPDDEVTITQDTIGTINHAIATSPLEGWYKLILDKKSFWGNVINYGADVATNAAMGGIGSLTDLVPNI